MTWAEQAASLLLAFCREHETFTSNDAFEYAHSKGLPEPSSPNQYGPLFKRVLLDANLVVPVGISKSKNPKAHGRTLTVVRSTIYRHEGSDTVGRQLAEISKKVKLREIDLATALRKAYEFGAAGKKEA